MISLIQSAIAYLVAFGVLVIIHELGHYSVARLCGVKVLRFSVGMGKVVYARHFGADQTEWVISSIPLGGYVKMLDARDQDVSDLSEAELKHEFTRQSVWRRIAIVAAGPIANFLLAIVLLCGLYMHGIPGSVPRLGPVAEHTAAFDAGLRGGEVVVAVNGEPLRAWAELRSKLVELVVEKKSAQFEFQHMVGGNDVHGSVALPLGSVSSNDLDGDFMHQIGLDLAYPKAILRRVVDGDPAMLAGLQEGDMITSIDHAQVANWLQVVNAVRAAPGKTLQFGVRRNGHDINVNVTPKAIVNEGRATGQIGAEPYLETVVVVDNPFAALGEAVQQTWESSILQLKMLGKMVIGEASWKNISGPFTIADYAGQTARAGAIDFLRFIAFISISLGVMNLLPIPVLDGGLLLYYSLEVLTGRPVSKRFGEIAQSAGIGILITLMIIALFNDAHHFA